MIPQRAERGAAIDALNHSLDRACDVFAARFTRAASVEFLVGDVAHELAFCKMGSQWIFAAQAGGGARTELLTQSLAVRIAASHQLHTLWEACLQADADQGRELDLARQAVADFLLKYEEHP